MLDKEVLKKAEIDFGQKKPFVYNINFFVS